jgi:hypothetical protein
MWRSVALVRTDVSEESISSINRVTRIGQLGTTLAVTITGSKQQIHTVNVFPSSHPHYRTDNFLRNVDSYKSPTASHSGRQHCFWF